MSRTEQPSGYIDGEDFASSSLQETPDSPEQQFQEEGDLISNLNLKAQQINNHLMKMQQHERLNEANESETLSPLPESEL